jgi:hypothetical protein
MDWSKNLMLIFKVNYQGKHFSILFEDKLNDMI